jgi:hypothetical protein
MAMKSNFPLRLPASIKRAAEDLAQEDGVSLNQFIASAVAEKVSALRTVEYLQARAKRADRAAFRDVLARAGRGAPPVAGDELPADLTGPGLTGGEGS